MCTRRRGVYSLERRESGREEGGREGTYDITTGTWRIKCCTAYVMRDCRSACTTRDVLDSGLSAFFFSFFSFLFQSTLLTANHDFDATTSIDLVVWIGGKSFETYRNGSSGRFILVFVIGVILMMLLWRERMLKDNFDYFLFFRNLLKFEVSKFEFFE